MASSNLAEPDAPQEKVGPASHGGCDEGGPLLTVDLGQVRRGIREYGTHIDMDAPVGQPGEDAVLS